MDLLCDSNRTSPPTTKSTHGISRSPTLRRRFLKIDRSFSDQYRRRIGRRSLQLFSPQEKPILRVYVSGDERDGVLYLLLAEETGPRFRLGS